MLAKKPPHWQMQGGGMVPHYASFSGLGGGEIFSGAAAGGCVTPPGGEKLPAPQHVGAGVQHVGAGVQHVGAGAQHVGAGAQQLETGL